MRDDGRAYVFLSCAAYALNFFQSIALIKLLSPTHMGVFISLQVILTFGIHFHFGVLNALNFYLPKYVKDKKHFSAKKIVLDVRGAIYCFMALMLLFSLTTPFIFDDVLYKWGALSMFLATSFALLTQLNIAILRSRGNFSTCGKVTLFESAIGLVMLPAVYFFSIYGACFRQIVVSVAVLAIALRYLDMGLAFRFVMKRLKVLILAGVPIMAVGVVYLVFSNLNRLMAIKYLQPKDVGTYSIGLLAGSVCLLLPSLVSQYFYNQTVSLRSQGGIFFREQFRVCLKSTFFCVASCTLTGISLYALAPTFVSHFYPSYRDGIQAANFTIVTMVILSFGQAPFYLMIAASLKLAFISATIFAIIVSIIFVELSSTRSLMVILEGFLIGTIAHQFMIWIFLYHRYVLASREKI